MHDTYCWGFISFVVSSLILCCCMLLFGYFLGGRSYSRYKNTPFESGVVSTGYARIRFSVKFCLIAIIFVIFDVEGIYLYIWSISVRELGWTGFSEIFIFVTVLLSSLIYLIRVGVFNWSSKSLKRTCSIKNIN